MAEEKKTTLKEANELARTIFNSMTYEQRKRLGAPDDRLREINALIEKGDYLSMAHLKKRKKELEDWLIDWYKEICKSSLQAPETSRENGNSFTSLDEAAIDYADYARKQPKDYAISSIADYDHGCIDGFKAGAEWQKNIPKELSSDDLEKAAKEYSRNVSDGHNYRDLTCGFIAGAEWMKEKDTRDMYMSDNRHYEKVYELGKKDMKKKMLEDAVERTVKIDSGGYPYIEITAELYDYEHNVPLAKEGELVKIIIVPIKED